MKLTSSSAVWTNGHPVPGANGSREKTIAWKILHAHSKSADPSKLRITFDSLISHDITYVGISKVGSVQGLSLIHILRHGIKTVIIPAENEKDLEEIDQTVRQSLNFITVSHVDSVIAAALVSGEAPAEAPVLDAMPAMPPVTPKARRKPGIRQ